MTATKEPSTALFADPVCKEHETGWGHPEQSARFDAVMSALETAGLLSRLQRLEGGPAEWADIEACHGAEYIEVVKEDVARGAGTLRTGDTDICAQSLDVALLAAGHATRAVDAVCEGRARNAFCAMRPPGHHAMRDQGMGFCVFNNVAVAARYAQRKHGIGKALIVDWDVHHGNGTQDIFYFDGDVFYFSTHQDSWYPGTGYARETGAAAGAGTTLNVPVQAGAGRDEILGAFKEQLAPAMESFKPEMVFISAGFDSRAGDPLGMLALTDTDFADLTRFMMDLADTYTGGRLVSVLEGGYDLDGLGLATAAHVAALLEGAAGGSDS